MSTLANPFCYTKKKGSFAFICGEKRNCDHCNERRKFIFPKQVRYLINRMKTIDLDKISRFGSVKIRESCFGEAVKISTLRRMQAIFEFRGKYIKILKHCKYDHNLLELLFLYYVFLKNLFFEEAIKIRISTLQRIQCILSIKTKYIKLVSHCNRQGNSGGLLPYYSYLKCQIKVTSD
jgi:hypothetical protein